MPGFRPFQGIRYSSSEALGDLVCPPYDVISEREQAELHDRHPHNAVRLEFARKDASGGYGAVGATFARWLSDGVLARDPLAAFYVYRQDFSRDGGRRRVTGVIGALALEEFGETAGVLPHERTMPGPKEDRLNLMRSCPANISPIYAIYRGGGGLAGYFDSLEGRPVAARFTDAGGIHHRLWVVGAVGETELLRAAVEPGPLVIADGHHRYETALAFHRDRSAAGAPGGHDAMMCFAVDADAEDLVVLPYHRALRVAVGSDEITRRLSDIGARPFSRSDAVPDDWSGQHLFVFVLEDQRFIVELSDEQVRDRVGDRHPAWRRLDVVALHEVLLPKLFPEGVTELAFTKDAEELQRWVRTGEWPVGVILAPMQAADVVDVARSGERLPQKASYFWPKALTGLVFRSLE